ncbi:hypothetical protein [Vibrio sp. qd031]|uniref:hypothetical protein n=1 Tax=Vibrio sp. qd031 TaxID=1603038 RepID=UPI0015561374|nr:hypothetical protein [Vibrio sp. qd031]
MNEKVENTNIIYSTSTSLVEEMNKALASSEMAAIMKMVAAVAVALIAVGSFWA